ncbi:tRNA (cytidine(34)-2'-O)-methyltransferase [bacterium]|jgi:tRNA (cytidine/uridine-2'-O-)-methyltransferase|nr:tRNA (cytidine(34)-2'-O)-methyltransferase [bacterium]
MPHELNVVLVEPEIPQNTGTIGRLCLATGATLHLVEPLGFDISDAAVKRAGLDYWQYLKLIRHPSIEAFLESLPPDAPRVFISKKSGPLLYDYSFQPGTYLIFGKETAGLPDWILNAHAADSIRIPMYDARVRSLNLSNAVGICVYEAIRQLGYT